MILSNNDVQEKRQDQDAKIDEKTGSDRDSNRDIPTTKSITISSVVSHVFRRPYVAVRPETPLLELRTYLATANQI